MEGTVAGATQATTDPEIPADGGSEVPETGQTAELSPPADLGYGGAVPAQVATSSLPADVGPGDTGTPGVVASPRPSDVGYVDTATSRVATSPPPSAIDHGDTEALGATVPPLPADVGPGGTQTGRAVASPRPDDLAYGGTQSGALFDVDMPVRLPSAISPSRAGDFMQCPLLFRLRVVDKVPEPPSAAATRGTLVHAVLDRLFDLPAGGRTPQEAAALLQPEWERLLAKEPELGGLFGTPQELAEWLTSAKSLLGKYFTLEDPNRLEPAERELFVHAVVGEGEDRLTLRGVVDRLDIAPNGLLRVVDYKTGKAPPAGYEAKTLFQMKFYALVLWKLRGVVPKRLQLIFLGSGNLLTYDPDEQDLRGVEQKVTAIWAAIRAAAQQREWPATPSRLCDWCSFKATCPAHGGEVPPAPIVEFLPAAAPSPAAAASARPTAPDGPATQAGPSATQAVRAS